MAAGALTACDKQQEPPKGAVTENNMASFITINRTDTALGFIETAQFNTEALDGDDIAMANSMFESIEETILKAVDECEKNLKENGQDISGASGQLLCETKAALNDNILSVLVHYGTPAYYAPLVYYYEAVNIDINTGKTIPAEQLIEKAGFSQQDIEDSLFWYGDRCKMREWENEIYFDFGALKTLPDGLGDPHHAWEDELDEMLENFRSKPQAQGVEWDALDRYPTMFYEGDEKLSVCGRIPTAAGAGYAWVMVRAGNSYEEVAYNNPFTCHGEAFGNNAMLPDTACSAAAAMLGLDGEGKNADGTKLYTEAFGMDILDAGKGQYEPYYLIRVYEELETHVATTNWLAVGVFSGTILEEDIASGQWKLLPNRTETVSDLVISKKEKGSIAAIYNDPSAYELWAALSYADIDLTLYGNDPDAPYPENIEEILLYAVDDGITVSFSAGAEVGGRFEAASVLYQLELPKAQSVKVRLVRPDGTATQAITVQSEQKSAVYMINASAGDEKIEYLKPGGK